MRAGVGGLREGLPWGGLDTADHLLPNELLPGDTLALRLLMPPRTLRDPTTPACPDANAQAVVPANLAGSARPVVPDRAPRLAPGTASSGGSAIVSWPHHPFVERQFGGPVTVREETTGPNPVSVVADATADTADRHAASVAGLVGLPVPGVRDDPRLGRRSVIALQRAAGNRAVGHLLGTPQQPRAVQRQDNPPAPVVDPAIDKAVKSGNALDITAIQDYGKVSEGDRIRFIGILVGETSEAISGGHIVNLWRSFGEQRLQQLVLEQRPLWDRCVTLFGGDPYAILPTAIVARLRAEYEGAVQQRATETLSQNEFVRVEAHGAAGPQDG